MANIELQELIQEKIKAAKHFRVKWQKRMPPVSKKYVILGIVAFCCLFISVISFVLSPPFSFAKGVLITVTDGESLGEIAVDLEHQRIVRSPFVFKIITKVIFRNDTGIIAGDYVFEKELNAFSVARRLATGKFNLEPRKVTIPEGLNKFELADLLGDNLINFDKEAFIAAAPEGYLFPDTYFFLPNASSEEVIKVMNANFSRQLEEIQEKVTASERGLTDIMTMASIVEREARKSETRKIIAGILWNRLAMGMPLQVDVTFKYINGKTTFDLTDEDLTVDSLYNTYKYPGLPPTPIANPGMDSILATLDPIKTDFVFFLSDQEGEMHYAKTFEEHVNNKNKYIY